MKDKMSINLGRFKKFMANNRIAQLLAVIIAIVLLWLTYLSVSSLLSTIRSQSLIEAMAVTLGEEYQVIDIEGGVDTQSTNFKVNGSIFRQGDEGLGAEASLAWNEVDQDSSSVGMKFTSGRDGQFVYIGDLGAATTLISSFFPSSVDRVNDLSGRVSKTWVKVSDLDDKCYKGIAKTLGDKDSELSKVMISSYIKNPLIRVHYINTLKDDSREYYISPIFSNLKNFARDIKDSKTINKIDGCKDGADFIDSLATMSAEQIKGLKSTEASVRNANLVVNVKDGRMSKLRSLNVGGEDTVLTIGVTFKQDEKGRKIEQPKESDLLNIDSIKDDVELLMAEAQEFAAQQQQMQQYQQGM